MSDRKTVFLTGTTGLIGSHLLASLLRDGYRVYALARSSSEQPPDARVTAALKFWDKDAGGLLSRLIVLEGDIAKENFGLERKVTEALEKEVDEIFHCAAVTNLNWPLDKIRKVNVEGTRHLLQLAERCAKKNDFRRVNHLSTAYVCGDYQDEFAEGDLDVGQGFKSTYEQSKFEAEKVVHEYRTRGLWVDIFRPAVVVGELRTGKTFQFKHIYQLIQVLLLGIFDELPLKNTHIHFVPIDAVSCAIRNIASHSASRNRTYNIFSDRNISLEEFVAVMCAIAGIPKPGLSDYGDFDVNNLTPVQKTILQNNFMSLNLRARFNCSFTTGLLKTYGCHIEELRESALRDIFSYYIKNKDNVEGPHAKRV